MTEAVRTIRVDCLDEEQIMNLVGPKDRNLNTLSKSLGISIGFRENAFIITDCDNDEGEMVQSVIHKLCELVRNGKSVTEQDVIYACRMGKKSEAIDYDEMSSVIIGRTVFGKAICPKTQGQLEFAKAMKENTIVFAVGPAGTGKTYLAVMEAVSALKRGDVKRIVLTRPAVEAGENLGFLPGDLKEKVDPYLTPLYDALYETLGNERTEGLIEKGTIEVAPLAYMRGRTLNDAFVILDEAQNTTTSQMKMFLTRLGFHSHMVITGDITQIDLNYHVKSGLVQAQEILTDIDDIAILKLSADDVVRHPLVQKMIEKYEQAAEKERKIAE